MPDFTSSTLSPFRPSFGNKIGAGKDNKVYEFQEPFAVSSESRYPRRVGELIVKISNEQERGEAVTSEQAINAARYNKAKYQMLREFLGDFVPQSMFLVGSKQKGSGVVVNKSYTVQERVPQLMISELGPEQRNSDQLRSQMYELVSRLQVMHRVLGRAREIVEAGGGTFLVEDSLDLGPLSKFVRGHIDDNAATFNYKQFINGYKASPNLLVDPATMQLSCVDFGQGVWTEELGLQMGIVHDIVSHDATVQEDLARFSRPAQDLPTQPALF